MYGANEALHLSDQEKNTLLTILKQMENEYNTNIDHYSHDLLVSNIELLLNYCKRYYGRQFITRTNLNKDIIIKFETFITNYIASGDLQKAGLPTVKFCAEQMHLSPNYFSDLLKSETGKNTQEHIHYYLLEKAKTMLTNNKETVNEIAYQLGFEYPPYFSKLFRKKWASHLPYSGKVSIFKTLIMERYIPLPFILFAFFTIPLNIYAQSLSWKSESTDDGKINVNSRIYKCITSGGKEQQVVEYIATTATKTDMKKLVSLLKDIGKHKEFMNQETSFKVKTLSEYEWIVYYFYKGVWPYPSSDIVTTMKYNEDAVTKIVNFTLNAAPAALENKGVIRLDYYHLNYSFKKLDNEKIEITVFSKFTPAVQLPAFIVRNWFPEGPANYLKNMIRIANRE